MQLPASIEADEYSRWEDDDPADAGPSEAAEVGAVTTLVAGPEADGGRLDKWLATRLPGYSRSRLQRWIADGHVRIDGRVGAVRDAVHDGDEVVVAAQPRADETAFVAEDVRFPIVHEDDTLIVVDKPAGLVVHPAAGNWRGTLLNGLLRHDIALAAVPRAGIVHRLDKDTSGLMVVAKTIEAQTDLVRQLQARTVGRTYLAIVHGVPGDGRVDWPIGRDPRERTRMAAFKVPPGREPPSGAKPAATRFETLGSADGGPGWTASLVVCRLETGRTHQIRVHLQALGHPLVGDPVYGGATGRLPFGRQALHAWRLALVHPRTRATAAWRAAPPPDFAGLAATIGLDLATLLATPDER